MSPILSTFSFGRRQTRPSSSGVTVSYVANAFSTTHQITIPATAAANDIVVICWTGRDSYFNSPANADPSGWTLIGGNFNQDSIQGNDVNTRFWYKKIVSGDVNSTVTVADSLWPTDVNSLIVLRPSVSATPTVASFSVQSSSGDPTQQTRDGTSVVTPHVTLAFYKSNGSITTRTESSGTFTELSSGTTNYIKYKIFNTNAERLSTNIDMADYGWNGLASCIISFAKT
jgi:hypothetical protein